MSPPHRQTLPSTPFAEERVAVLRTVLRPLGSDISLNYFHAMPCLFFLKRLLYGENRGADLKFEI